MNTYCVKCGHKTTFFGLENKPKSCAKCGFGEKKKKTAATATISTKPKKDPKAEDLSNLIGFLLANASKNEENAGISDQEDEYGEEEDL